VDRALHILSVALITAGVVILADVAATLIWQEPTSSVYASVKQHEADAELVQLEQEFPAPADRRVARHAHGRAQQVGTLADLLVPQVHSGQAIGRVVIPAIDLDIVMVQGTDTADLAQGPGHYASTPLPGQPGTTAIAGHRTTYLAPFRHLDALNQGDLVEIEMPYGTFDYRIQGTRVVEPTDVGILHRVGYQRLVLTACHPLYSASQRIAAFAKLERIRSDALGGRQGSG
jgi:sortase A